MAAPSDDMTPQLARQLAADVFLLGFPLILMDAVRRAHPVAASRFFKLPTRAEGFAAGLSKDDPRTVQSAAAIDLAAGPARLQLPDTEGRFLSLTLIDSAGEPFASFGSRGGQHAGGEITLVGPNWDGEVDEPVRRAPSDAVWAVSCIVARSRSDVAAAETIASAQRVRAALAPEDGAAMQSLDALAPVDLPPVHQVAALAPETLFHRLTLLIERAPLPVQERLGPAVSARLTRLGAHDDPHSWPDDLRRGMVRGFSDALQAITAAAEHTGERAGGWRGLGHSERSPSGGPLSAAVRALSHLGAPAREDVLTLVAVADETDRPLTGAERYRLHFNREDLPPAARAWSLSAEPFASAEAVDLMGEQDAVNANPDGSLDILIEARRPGESTSANVLRAPPGSFQLSMRLYWPQPAAINGAWRMPPVERLGSRVSRRPESRAAPRTSRRRPARATSARPFIGGQPRDHPHPRPGGARRGRPGAARPRRAAALAAAAHSRRGSGLHPGDDPDERLPQHAHRLRGDVAIQPRVGVG